MVFQGIRNKDFGQIAIAICGAEASFNDQIINMLEQVAVIDECDTLGQKLDPGNAIHKVR